MRVLVACEFSGVVRRAFRAAGHDAFSCDLLPSEDDSPHHFQMDVRQVIGANHWDMMIAHPPCTHLAVSGARWFKDKRPEQEEALRFVRELMDAPIERIAIENPISIISSRIRRPDQIIQPWQFGHGETKATCLWLKNLPVLQHTNIVDGREARVHRMPPGENRWRERSRTFEGVAAAMAEQWGKDRRMSFENELADKVGDLVRDAFYEACETMQTWNGTLGPMSQEELFATWMESEARKQLVATFPATTTGGAS